MWLRQVFRDPAVREADLLYSRIPAMFGIGGFSPLPFATDHYRPWPDIYPASGRMFAGRRGKPHCLGYRAPFALRRRGLPAAAGVPGDGCWWRTTASTGRRTARQARGAGPARPAPGAPIAVYAGRINAQKGLDTILALADLRPEVLFVLVGSEGHGAIEQAAARRANVRVVPWAEPDALPPWLFAADVLLIPPSSAPLEHFGTCVLPIKLFTYLAAGRPILAPDAPDTRELLTHEQTALLVEPDGPSWRRRRSIGCLAMSRSPARFRPTRSLWRGGSVGMPGPEDHRVLAAALRQLASSAGMSGYDGGGPPFPPGRASSSNM